MPTHPEFVAEVGRVTSEFARVARTADLDAEVPACPGWTAHDLVEHVGVVHRWAAAIVRTGERQATDVPGPPRDGEGAAAWYAEGADELIAALERADPGAPCWNFSGLHQHAGFWSRRQAHEVHVHLIDLTRAVGARMDRVPSHLSADGVGEVLDTFMPRLPLRDVYPAVTAPLALVVTDLDIAWVLEPGATPEAGGASVDRPSLPALRGPLDGARDLPEDQVRGKAESLLEVLWKRSGAEIVEKRGDRGRVSRYLASQLTS